MTKAIGYLFGLIVAVIITIPIAIWEGYVLSTLWNWFVVPELGAPALGVIAAAGIALLVNTMTSSTALQARAQVDHEDDTAEEKVAYFVHMVLLMLTVPAVALGIGWILHTIYV